MSPINSKIYRFADAIHIAETTPKSLRKWLQNPEVKLPSSGEEDGWREFNFADLMVLATMRKLVDFGQDVAGANAFAMVINMAHSLVLYHEGNASPAKLVRAFSGVRAFLYQIDRPEDPWQLQLASKGKLFDPPAASFLTIRMEALARRVFERLVEVDPEAAKELGAPAPILSVDGKPPGRAKRSAKKRGT